MNETRDNRKFFSFYSIRFRLKSVVVNRGLENWIRVQLHINNLLLFHLFIDLTFSISISIQLIFKSVERKTMVADAKPADNKQKARAQNNLLATAGLSGKFEYIAVL